MKDISAFAKIFLAKDSVDFRKQANGLLVIVKESLGLKLFDGLAYGVGHPAISRQLLICWSLTKKPLRLLA